MTSEKKQEKDEPTGYRVNKRREKRSLIFGRIRVIFTSAFGILLVVTGLIIIGVVVLNPPKGGSTGQKNETTKVADQATKQKETFLLIGVIKSDDQAEARGILAMIIDHKDKTAYAISIPEDTFVGVPGHGFEEISQSLRSGITTTLATVKDLLGVDIDYYLKIGYSDFKSITKKKKVEEAFKKATETDLSQKERRKLIGEIKKFKRSDIEIYPLPTETLKVGDERYLQPEREKMERLVSSLWGKEVQKAKQEVQVLILNGCGKPGIAGKVAEKLIKSGYKIVDTRNARNFNYNKTQILVYKKKGQEEATNIKELLGMGVILKRSIPQDVADLAVIVGKDYFASLESGEQLKENEKPKNTESKKPNQGQD